MLKNVGTHLLGGSYLNVSAKVISVPTDMKIYTSKIFSNNNYIVNIIISQ